MFSRYIWLDTTSAMLPSAIYLTFKATNKPRNIPKHVNPCGKHIHMLHLTRNRKRVFIQFSRLLKQRMRFLTYFQQKRWIQCIAGFTVVLENRFACPCLLLKLPVLELYQMKWGIRLHLPRNLYGWGAWMGRESDNVHMEKWGVSSRSRESNLRYPQQFQHWTLWKTIINYTRQYDIIIPWLFVNLFNLKFCSI